VGEGHFDGLMNYPLRGNIFNFVNQNDSAKEYADKIEGLLKLYPMENDHAMYNLLGSHDVERLWNNLDGNLNRLKLAYLILFAFPGIPAIYYGDEIGITGGSDPDCRKVFSWQPQSWNLELREWVKKLIAMRKDLEALKRGDYQRLHEEDRCLAYLRAWGEQRVIVGVNASREIREFQLDAASLGVPDGLECSDLVDRGTCRVENGRLTLRLEPVSGSLFRISS
jgi:cyclomaltodextrinase